MSSQRSDTEQSWISRDASGRRTARSFSSLSDKEINKCAAYCNEIIEGTNAFKNRGIRSRQTELSEALKSCMAECLARDLEKAGYSRTDCLNDIRNVISNNPDLPKNGSFPVSLIMDGLDPKYDAVEAKYLMEADTRSHSFTGRLRPSKQFLFTLGLNLTEKELRVTLYEKDSDGKPRERMLVAKERLGLVGERLSFHYRKDGLSFKEMSIAFSIKDDATIETLTDEQLELLTSKLITEQVRVLDKRLAKWLGLAKALKAEMDKRHQIV